MRPVSRRDTYEEMLMLRAFNEFVIQKDRDARKHLDLVKAMFEKAGMQVEDKLDLRDDPYIFVRNPDNNLSFEGVRVYELGRCLAYRVQKEADTHPYGRAYGLNVQDMFDDLSSEERSDDEIGQEIVKSVVGEVKDFFEKSLEAEQSGRDRFDPLSRILMRPTDTDFGNQVNNVRGNRYR